MPSLSSTLTAISALSLLASSLADPHANAPQQRSQRHRDLARTARTKRQATTNSTSAAASSSSGIDPNPVLGGFKVVGDSGVSAQMMFLGTEDTVYILDKTENNSMTVTTPAGTTRPAWGTSYDLNSNTATPMSVTSNTFCAGGMTLADGRWAIFGGNQPVTYEGAAVKDQPGKANPYGNTEGGDAIRVLTPCDDQSCEYEEGSADLTMTGKRWYPTIEALADGSLMVIGGDTNGGYVSTLVQNNPTYEFFPKQGGAIDMQFLTDTVPLNLFPLTWLMPSGKIFLQAFYATIMYDLETKTETRLPDMPYAARVYPASGATAMLPLTPANNYNPTLLFCGGSDSPMQNASDGGAKFNITSYPADDTCVRITPEDANPAYEDDDNMPEGRSMGQFIYLPDGTMWMGNGVGMGTAGYGDEGWSFGQSYGQDPLYMPAVYDPNAPKGSRFSREGLSASNQERMYHSSAILLRDGSILVSGSNPNKDVTFVKWGTSYVVEKWYPLWYSKPRPQVDSASWPASLTYGGDYWNITYTPTDSTVDPGSIKVVVIRTGFSTHGMNMGQRYMELATSYTKVQEDDDVTIHVSQMPPNANIFQPGPAMVFLVENGVPSLGKLIMIGSGAIETQQLLAASVLPGSAVIVPGQETSNDTQQSITAAAGPAATVQANSKVGGASAVLARSPLVAVLSAMAASVLAVAVSI